LTTPISSRPRRTALRALVGAVLLGLVLAVAAAGPAAASACGDKVIDDWYDDGRVDGSYELHCYDDAIDALPRDVKDYSSAKDDIERALQNRLNDKPAPPATTDPSPDEPGVGTPEDLDGDGIPNEEDPSPGKPGDDDGGGPEAGAGDVDTAAADSVPVPLLVLAGLALLLVAAGSAGYITRRLQARRLPPPSS